MEDCNQGGQMSLSKNRPTCSPTHILQNKYKNFTIEKSSPEVLATFVIFKKTVQRKHSPNRRKFAQSGHPDCNGRHGCLSLWRGGGFFKENSDQLVVPIYIH
jgi:hypothetical protein